MNVKTRLKQLEKEIVMPQQKTNIPVIYANDGILENGNSVNDTYDKRDLANMIVVDFISKPQNELKHLMTY